MVWCACDVRVVCVCDRVCVDGGGGSTSATTAAAGVVFVG